MAKANGDLASINCFDSVYSEFHEDPSKGSLLVMTDLKALGYEAAETQNTTFSLSLPHLKLALKELAKFHAFGEIFLRN